MAFNLPTPRVLAGLGLILALPTAALATHYQIGLDPFLNTAETSPDDSVSGGVTVRRAAAHVPAQYVAVGSAKAPGESPRAPAAASVAALADAPASTALDTEAPAQFNPSMAGHRVLPMAFERSPHAFGGGFAPLSSAMGHPGSSSGGGGGATGAGSAADTGGAEDGSGQTGLDDGGPGLTPVIGPVDSLSAAPEPSTWVMLLAGFGLMGGLLRRRRPKYFPQA